MLKARQNLPQFESTQTQGRRLSGGRTELNFREDLDGGGPGWRAGGGTRALHYFKQTLISSATRMAFSIYALNSAE